MFDIQLEIDGRRTPFQQAQDQGQDQGHGQDKDHCRDKTTAGRRTTTEGIAVEERACHEQGEFARAKVNIEETETVTETKQ